MRSAPRRRQQRLSRPLAAYALRTERFLAKLAFALLAASATVRPASAQTTGCSRCSVNAFAPPTTGPASFPAERAWRSWERRGSAESRSRRRVASLDGALPGGSVVICVRTCDGGFFPLPYSRASGASLTEICQALCPNAEVALFSMPFGGTVDQSVSLTGTPYTSQPNALKFQQSYDETCSCRRPGQSWADALAAAEAKYGHHAHEIIITAQVSAEMSRPKPDPNVKPAASVSKPEESQPIGTPDSLDPELDVNGVDTKLQAATKAVSRETSGIRDDEAKAASHFGLTQGQVVEETDPDGGRRKVRILAPSF